MVDHTLCFVWGAVLLFVSYVSIAMVVQRGLGEFTWVTSQGGMDHWLPGKSEGFVGLLFSASQPESA